MKYGCLSLLLACHTLTLGLQFQSHIQNNDGNLIVDGSYSTLTTLTNRLPFIMTAPHAMTKRHLWNYMAILTLALDTFPENYFNNYKTKLTRAIHRLQLMTLPDMQYLEMEDSFHYQIDSSILSIVHQDLKAILVPPPSLCNMTDDQVIDFCLESRPTGTTAMFRRLFQIWEITTTPSILHLLARNYLPHLYILHMTHDGDYLYHQSLYDSFYSPLHQELVPLEQFRAIGSAEQYELALILADSLSEHNRISSQ